MKKSLLLTIAAILLIGIIQKFDGQEMASDHCQLSHRGNIVIDQQSNMAQAPFFSRQEPNRWTSDHTFPYKQRMTKPLGQRDCEVKTTITGTTLAQHQLSAGVDTAWVRHYAGEPIPGIDRAVDIVLDQSGNIYVTGYVASAESGYDYYTIKYNSAGSAIWSARYDGMTGDDMPVDMCVDAAGNIYVTGTSGRGFATIKYDDSGVELWVAQYNRPTNTSSTVAGMAVDDSGNVYVAGTIEISNTLIFFLIIKYDPTGKEEWTARYDGQYGAGNEVVGIVVDGFGNVIVSGSFCSLGEGIFDKDYTTLKYNSNGTLKWAARFNGLGNNEDEPTTLAVDPSGNVYVTGYSTFASGGGSCYATVKYDSFGAQQWVAIYNSPQSGWSYPNAIATDESGCVYVGGGSLGVGSYSDYATIKYNALGEEQWVARYNGPENSLDGVSALALDGSDNVYVTGSSVGAGTDYDFATIKYDANGIEQWIARFNGPDSTGDIPTAIALDESGMVYVTGAGDIHYSWGMPYELHCNYATVKYNASGVEQWVAHYDGPGDIYASLSDMAIDEAGNVYVTGYAQVCRFPENINQMDWNDYVTVKYDANGTVLWAVRCKEGSRATNIAVDDRGNSYVTGFIDGGGYLTVKYNASGEAQWVAHCNKDVVAGYSSLAVDRSGNVYIAGGIDVTDRNSDYIVIKYDSSGNEQWLVTYDGPGHFFDEATAIAVDDSGNVYVTGKSYGAGTLADFATIKYDAQGIGLWIARYNGSANSWDEGVDIAVDVSGNVFVTGRTRSSTTGEDFVTIKYDATGTMQWIARYNGTKNRWDEATALALDNAGNVLVIGMSNDYGDYTTIKYDNAGTQQWVAHYSSSGGRSYDLAVDASGNVYVTGLSNSDFTTIKYNAAGVEQWMAQFNGPGNSYDNAWSITADDAGFVYVAGTSSGSNWSMMTTIKYTETGTPVVSHESDALPKDFNLAQNYPNPFNPSTTIEFALPKSAFVTLKIYNLLGEEIATLVWEKREAGVHRVNWDARGLASGVYLYQLEAGKFKQTRKMLLVR